MRPLDEHPELSVSKPASGVVEFRVENWRLRKGRTRGPREGLGLVDLVLGAVSGWACYKFGPPQSILYLCLWVCTASLYFYFQCTRLLHESIVVLPLHGVQLESHRGLRLPFSEPLPLTARRRFIPLTSIREIVINEGLRRWDVRYYICIIRDVESRVFLDVAFENILPRLPILEFVYNGVHDLLENPDPPKANVPKNSGNINSS